MAIKIYKYILILLMAILSVSPAVMAEWYIKPSGGGAFATASLEIGREFMYESPISFQNVDMDAEDVVNLKLGYWFTESFLTRKFPNLQLGIEMELEKYSFSSHVSFTQTYYDDSICARYELMYDWWTDRYVSVCVEWTLVADEYGATYSITGDEMRVGVNILIRKMYKRSEYYPAGRAHLYGGAGLGYVISDIDVVSNGVEFTVADGEKSTNAVLLFGADYMVTHAISIFVEINFIAVPHDYPVPGLGMPDKNTSTHDSGSVYLMGMSYHFF